MNRERALRLIAAMEAAPDSRFDMRNLFTLDGVRTRFFGTLDPGKHACGSAACIAGWAIWVAGAELPQPARMLYGHDSLSAGAWLGLTTTASEELFMPENYMAGSDAGFTRVRAVAVLRDMVEQSDDGTENPLPRWGLFRPDGTVGIGGVGVS